MSDFIRHHSVATDYKKGETWTILSEIEQSIKKKIEAAGTPLKDWNVKINYGIKTGLNEAFIISKEKRDELVKADPKSVEIIRPILRGRDIKRYKIDFKELYLINTHNGYQTADGTNIPPIKIDNYPAIKKWLETGDWNTKPSQGSNLERLRNRTDQGITPYNLRSLAYMDNFLQPKIVWSDIATSPKFSLIENEIFINNTAYMITGTNPNIVHILNSKITKWLFPKISSDLGMGARYFKQFVVMLPLPDVHHSQYFYDDLTKQNVDKKLAKYYNLTELEAKFIGLF